MCCGSRKKRSQSESELSRTPDDGYESTATVRPQYESVTSPSTTLTDSMPTLDVCDPDPGQEHQKEESTGPGIQPRDAPSCSNAAMHTDENEEMVIASIRATDVALGLKRLPVGFYTTVHHSGLEWRTENKPSSVNDDVIEWNGQIPIPSDPSATIRIEVYGSFEFQPMLGAGEQLRKLTITVEGLLDCSARDIPSTFFPKDGEVVSPCSSILVTVKRRKCESSDSSLSRVIEPYCPTTEPQGELAEATNRGHSALSQFQKHGEKQDLEDSITEFVRALRACPLYHPCRAAAESNLALAKFVLCQVEGREALLPLGLYRDALRARPICHVDRPSTLIQLAAVHFARLEKLKDEVDRAKAEALLHEAMDLSSTESHDNRVARLMLQLLAGRSMGPVQPDGQSSAYQSSISHLTGEDLNRLSSRLLAQFELFGDLAHLEKAIIVLKELVGSSSVWHDWYGAGLSNLGVALRNRFEHLGKPSDLEDAISTLRDAIDLTPHGHHHRPAFLNNLGTSFFTRFVHLDSLSDLESAISMLTDAADLTPHNHLDKPARLSNLGACFTTRFERLGDLRDVEKAISMHTDAIHLTPRDHPDKPDRLSNLGSSFFTRFERLGDLSDLENAISMLRDAVDLIPHGHPNQPALLSNLGSSFSTRFEHLGELSDLENAISMLRDAVNLTPHSHLDKPSHLSSLGTSFRTRFERLGEPSDIENAISTLTDAVHLTPHGHPDKPGRLGNLGTSLSTLFQRLGELGDLENAISTLKDALDLTPHDHPHRPVLLSNLGTSFRSRFERFGELSDLEGAISALRDAVHLTPHGHSDKPGLLSNLGTSFVTRFERLGELSDLENAILTLRNAVDLTPHDRPLKPTLLNNLGTSFRIRFERLGGLSDLENAISTLKNAADLTPHDHPDKHSRLSNLGASLSTRFERLGEPSDLENAISTLRDAVDLTPHSHPDKPTLLSNLGASFSTRFEHFGDLSDLENAISTFRDAVHFTPDGHLDKPRRLSNLGISSFTRFERLGELGDLENAISMFRDAIDLTPHGHPFKLALLNNLGSSFRTRFERLNELNDLESAVSTLRDAVDLTPQGHPHKPGYLSNLGTSFFTRFNCLGELSDAEDAISALRNAVDLTPHNHPDKPGRLSNLGTSFKTRFERLGELSDLENAISTLIEAVGLTPQGHPHRSALLNNLGTSFRSRFERIGELSDLENAISTLRDAIHLTPRGHPDKPGYLSNLGAAFVARFERLGELSDIEYAVSIYFHAASSPFGPTRVRFRASQKWISCARRICHHSLLHAYSVAINLLPQLPWIGLSLTQRYSELRQGADVVRDAAAAALDSGFPETAVEWLERGRSIVWGELFQLRSSYEELSSVHPDHARRLRELSAALDHAGATREQSWSALTEQGQDVLHQLSTLEHASDAGPEYLSLLEHAQNITRRATCFFEEEALRHRMLAIQRDRLLQEIRRFPGFQQFLLQKGFSQLRTSAHAGPVVMLNAANSRCDALVVLADVNQVIHVPLPNFTFKRSAMLRNELKNFVRHAREGRRETLDGVSWESILSILWRCVVEPVLYALALSTPGDLLRIFWCPTGPLAFLPIHAAGFYDAEHSQPGHKVFDFVVSSYAPSLSILAPSPTVVPTGDLRFLAVRQPPSDGLYQLPGVVTELKRIRDVIGSSPSACTTIVESSVGTVEEVLSLMKEADWVHFACHGIQDPVNATDSGLCLANERRLKLSDIIALSRPQRGLAFLSACQTATGDDSLADEAIHITAGMIFAGYEGVIGTMWSISDRLAPDVARDVYEYLFRNGTRPDYREAARALHEAIRGVRDGGIASFEEWIPFIHVGL